MSEPEIDLSTKARGEIVSTDCNMCAGQCGIKDCLKDGPPSFAAHGGLC